MTLLQCTRMLSSAMTTLVPAICNGDTLKLERPVNLPANSRVYVSIVSDIEDSEHWRDDELRAFEATAYGDDEPYEVEDAPQ